jgi:APA family basic amino acid/polyamine antiporter
MAGSFVFTMWIFYGLAGATIFIMRVKRPDLPRAYRCFGYPLVPALFVASSAMMTVLSIMADWKTCLTWIGVLLAGIPVYLVWSRITAKDSDAPGGEETM